jgi:hypothetical protein
MKRVRLRAFAAALACIALACAGQDAPTAGQGAPVQAITPAAPSAPQPTREQIQAAAKTVRADPNLPGTRTVRTLRPKARNDKPDTPKDASASWRRWVRWLRDLLTFIVSSARVLVWVLGAALVVFVLLHLRRWAALRGDPAARRGLGPLPSHVGKLDIRPESLPEDIGGATAALWQRGSYEDRRAALSLLYRGALSRLVHGRAVPIRAASTEGECLALAQGCIPSTAHDFLARLIQVWQRAAYGGQLPETAHVLALCDGFALHLPAAAAPGAPQGDAA